MPPRCAAKRSVWSGWKPWRNAWLTMAHREDAGRAAQNGAVDGVYDVAGGGADPSRVHEAALSALAAPVGGTPRLGRRSEQSKCARRGSLGGSSAHRAVPCARRAGARDGPGSPWGSPVETSTAAAAGPPSAPDPAAAPARRRRRPRASRASGSPDGSGVGSSTAHSGGVEARCQVEAGTSTTSTSISSRRRTSRAQSARDARPPFTRWWIVTEPGARRRVGAHQLDDRLGQVRRVGGRADLVADDAERLARGLRAHGRGGDLGREVVAGRPVQPGGPDDRQAARAIPRTRRLASRSASAFAAPYGLIGLALGRRARSRGRRSAARRTPRWSR